LHRFHTLPVTLTGTDSERKRSEIRDYFLRSYTLFETLFDLLKDDSAFYRQSEPTRHPMIFYFGHTAAFFVNKLVLAKVVSERIRPEFESIFAVGVDEMAWDDMDESRYCWPSVSEVRSYRNDVKTLVLSLIDTLPLPLPITQESGWWVIMMGIEHERIHIETSSVLHRQMPLAYIKPSEVFTYCRTKGAVPVNRPVAFPETTIKLGKSHEDPYYGWDNEYGTAAADVAAFRASEMLVSNGEYLAFVEAGGYETRRYWDEEGWDFLTHRGVKHPPFWLAQEEGGFRLRLLDREIGLPLNWPVEVNCLEAEAFCRFKSEREESDFRLPTEAEWMVIAQRSTALKEGCFDEQGANINFAHFASAVPVDTYKQGALYDAVGNVWQWTSTPIAGYDGFMPHSVYDDFSLPTFDGKHNLVKGASWASTGNEITLGSRYAFRRHFYQHAGFRYVEAAALKRDESHNVYETDALAAQYCEFQYGDTYFDVPNFAQTCAEYAAGYAVSTPRKRALELGCATGRASFELAKVFEHVTGIDFSARFIQIGAMLQKEGRIVYDRVEEGDLTVRCEHSLAEFGLQQTADRVAFWQGDACNLKMHFTGYDLILAANLIDRLYEPALLLDTIHARLNDGGILVLTSPYTWQEEYALKAHWLGGYVEGDGEPVYGLDGIKSILEEHFELIALHDVPFVIRETARKFQHTVAQLSVWRKR